MISFPSFKCSVIFSIWVFLGRFWLSICPFPAQAVKYNFGDDEDEEEYLPEIPPEQSSSPINDNDDQHSDVNNDNEEEEEEEDSFPAVNNK